MTDRDSLFDVAEAILDGREVDWEALRRSASTDDVRALVSQLQALETISRGHRDSQDPPPIPRENGHEGSIDAYRIVHDLDECLVLARYEVVHEKSGARAVLNLVKWDIDARVALARFASVQRDLKALAGPGLGVVFASGVSPEGRVYLVEPLLRGATLSEWAHEAKLPACERLDLVARVAACLGNAHERGLAHGSITPLHVLAPDDERHPRLTGLGISNVLDIRMLEQKIAERTDRAIRFGRYLAPEQIEPGAQGPSARGDVYALGALIEDLISPPERGVALAAVIDRARSTFPAARPRDGRALAKALEDCRDRLPRV